MIADVIATPDMLSGYAFLVGAYTTGVVIGLLSVMAAVLTRRWRKPKGNG